MRLNTICPGKCNKVFAPAETASVPDAYHVPAALVRVIQKLEDHGVRFARAERAGSGSAEVFRIDSTSTAPREFQQHRERTVFGEYERREITIEPGDVIIEMDQPLARLIFTLLEPRAADGLTNWNVLDPYLRRGELYPIARLVR